MNLIAVASFPKFKKWHQQSPDPQGVSSFSDFYGGLFSMYSVRETKPQGAPASLVNGTWAWAKNLAFLLFPILKWEIKT